MALPASGPISIGQIADEFGIPRTSAFPSAFYGLGGAATSGTLALSAFYGRSKPTPTPTPAPTLTMPSISPASGTAGQTTFTATDGTPGGSYTSFTTRWMMGGTALGTGTTIVPQSVGDLYRENVVTGPGGTVTRTAGPVSVTAPGPAITFAPSPPGYYEVYGGAGADLTLSCSIDAVWTYTRTEGPAQGQGTSVTIASGATARSIKFGVAQTNAGGPRTARWSVHGSAGGVEVDYDVRLFAEGTGISES